MFRLITLTRRTVATNQPTDRPTNRPKWNQEPPGRVNATKLRRMNARTSREDHCNEGWVQQAGTQVCINKTLLLIHAFGGRGGHGRGKGRGEEGGNWDDMNATTPRQDHTQEHPGRIMNCNEMKTKWMQEHPGRIIATKLRRHERKNLPARPLYVSVYVSVSRSV